MGQILCINKNQTEMKAEIEKVLIKHGAVSPDPEQQESLIVSLLKVCESQLKERDTECLKIINSSEMPIPKLKKLRAFLLKNKLK